jgi:hypothetical protein
MVAAPRSREIARASRAKVRPPVRCEYCLGTFAPSRVDAITCSAACRQARNQALRVDEVMPASVGRRDTWSAERRQATGWGLVRCSEAYHHDLRVRRHAYVVAVLAAVLRLWWLQ